MAGVKFAFKRLTLLARALQYKLAQAFRSVVNLPLPHRLQRLVRQRPSLIKTEGNGEDTDSVRFLTSDETRDDCCGIMSVVLNIIDGQQKDAEEESVTK
jgi:hypothetical protein